MYLRHTTVEKNGKRHTYWRLVRSVRCGKRVRQETVACLGELDARGRAKARALAESFCGSLAQGRLFEEPQESEPVEVRLKDVRVERGRRFGDVWLAWMLWRALRLDELMERLLPAGREEVPWPTMAAVLALARLTEPSSELHIAEDWFRKTALDSLLDLPAEKVNEDRFYRALDLLLPRKAEIEKHLKERMGELFKLEYELVLYDVTSTYFEGEAQGNPMARRGYSRDHRPDCKQVCIALVVSTCGMPLGYEVFPGNRTDVTTLEEIVDGVEARYGKAQRIWVVDRGMISEKNMEFLRKDGRRYIVGTPRPMLKRFEQGLLGDDWHAVREGLEVKLCPGPDGAETFILCRSADRREKEKAMHARFEKRIEEGLEKIAGVCARSRHDPIRVARRVGALLGRNSRAAGLFDVEVKTEPDGRARLAWKKLDAWRDWATLSEGCYLLRTNLADRSAENLWKAYIQLTDAEAAFRIQKSDLLVRPIWHQKQERVLAHILVCFLAYVLWKTLEKWQSRAGLGSSPRVLLEELRSIQSADVILPTTDGRELKIRCVVRPDKAQQALLSRLGLTLPERLRPPKVAAKM
jgi:transposase